MNNLDKKVLNIKRHICRILKNAGVYNATIAYQVELVATDLLIYRKLRAACLDEDTSVLHIEKSREENDRLMVNPAFAELRRQSEIVQKGLDKLTMNIKSGKIKQEVDDSFSEFMNQFKNDGVDD